MLSLRINILFVLAVLLAAAGVSPAGAQSEVARQHTDQADMLALGLFKTQWQGDVVEAIDTNGNVVVRHDFQGATLDGQLPGLPVYEVRLPLEPGQRYTLNSANRYPITTQDTRYAPAIAQNEALFTNSALYPAEPIQLSPVYTQRKQRFQILRLYPVQVHVNGQQVVRHDQFGFELTPVNTPERRKTTSNTTESVLANGEWYKIGVTSEGMYRIDRNFLQELGIDVDNLDPRTIRIFNNGGGPVPTANSAPRVDDLAENAIVVTGENDGSFDSGDYAMFYGYPAHPFVYDTALSRFVNDYNFYTDTVYYFINVNQANGKRIEALPPATEGAPLDYGYNHAMINEQQYQLINVGREWFGDNFDNILSRNYDFELPNLKSGTDIGVYLRTIGRSPNGFSQNFVLRENGITIGTVNPATTNTASSTDRHARWGVDRFSIPAAQINDGALNFELEYNRSTASAEGWLDAIEVEYRAKLAPSGNFISYQIPQDTAGQSRRLQFSNMNGYELWDVSNPANIGALSDVGDHQYDLALNTTRRLVVFNRSGLKTPMALGKIANQNLHAIQQADYIVVTHPKLLSAANRLADFHAQTFGRSTAVATTTQVYNEFGGGRPDVSAIRDFVKMIYDRASGPQDAPQNLVLMGDGSYDPKGLNHATPLVPTVHACESLHTPTAFASDDFYTFMDENEGTWREKASVCPGDPRYQNTEVHYMDLGVGRIPANTLAEANRVVDKSVQYVTDHSEFNDWHTETLFFSDIKFHSNGNKECVHQRDNEYMTSVVEENAPCVSVNRLHIDTYPGEQLAEGLRYPQANADLIRQVNAGQLLVNYMGHGGETGLSTYRVFEMDDITTLKNTDRLSHWVTATCEFGRFDDPGRRSGAEQLLLNDRTGAISMFTAVRSVYVSGNRKVTEDYLESLFERLPDGGYRSFGEAFMHGKNKRYSNEKINHRCFTLLGDPGLPLALPKQEIVITEINNNGFDPQAPDTLKALSKVKLKGEVRQANGITASGFNGEVAVTVLDKPKDLPSKNCTQVFEDQNVRLFDGLADVQNGEFTLEFYVPLDISYEVGKGRIAMYAQAMGEAAYGCTDDVVICCTDENAQFDSDPPVVDVNMDDANWIDGSIVSSEPLLLAFCSDDQGINTTGLGIGRELTAVLNNDESQPIILNNYYQADKNSYNSGRIAYPMDELAPGTYTLRVKVWDVTNNSATDETTFIVADNAALALEGVLNYPNPFSETTTFRFNHNLAGQDLELDIKIRDQTGRLVKNIRQDYTPTSAIADDITWDGRRDDGNAISSGVYVYTIQLKVKATGETVSGDSKMVYIRQ